MATPCYKDNRFIGTAAEMRSVKKECLACPAVQWCGEAGLGEKEGVWGGTLPTDAVRVAHRKTNDRKVNCINGHPVEDYGVWIDSGGQKPFLACTYCSSLHLRLLEVSS